MLTGESRNVAWGSHTWHLLFYFLREGLTLSPRLEFQCREQGSLRPPTLGLGRFCYLSFPSGWDYRCQLPHLANFKNFFCGDRLSPYCPGWSLTPGLKRSSRLRPPKHWNHRHEPLCLATIYFLIHFYFLHWSQAGVAAQNALIPLTYPDLYGDTSN